MGWMHRGDTSRVVGINRRNAELIYPNNDRQNYRYGDDKLLAKASLEKAGVPVAPTLAVCDGLYAVNDTVAKLSVYESFVIKPSCASGGAGILVLAERPEPGVWLTPSGKRVDLAGLRKHLADIVFGAHSGQLGDVAFAEPMVRPHPIFQKLWTEGLCDLRVLTLQGVSFMAMLRIPTRASDGKANLHQGGVGAAVDLQTGRITRALWRDKLIEKHPESDASLVGVVLPNWKECLRIAELSASAVPLGYLGVDLVVDPEGQPLVLEVNVRPGLEIQNVHGQSIEEALRKVWP